MSAPIKPSPRQVTAFEKAVADRLGLDQTIIEAETFRVDFQTLGDDAKVSVSLIAHLPTDEVLAMFNGEEPPS